LNCILTSYRELLVVDKIDHFTTVQLCLPTSFCACLSLCATSWEKGGNESSNSRSNPASTLLHSAGVTLYNHVSLVLPASVAYLLELIVGVIGNLLLFDFQYFFWHLLHHRIRWLYVTFHAIHHNYSSPCALSLVTIGFWTTLNPIILRCHLLTTWAFMLLHVNVSIEDHSGYDFPWSTSRLIPLGIYGGPSKHGVHHQKPNTNFAPHFSHWDKIFGTHADFSFSSAMK
uniref:Fatty acid hydroxylase domain-containing protein n=1 Tax=Mola mola TaxID=94237 RepID=A0A3Q4AVP7_MOLML